MSVLAVPRIFFKGQMAWNPNTANNNDQWATYDCVNASLNWDCLATQVPPITPANAEQVFPSWAQTLQYYPNDPAPGWYQPPSEWNYYGGNECALHTATGQTVVTGGQAAHGDPVTTADSLVGALVDLIGDPFPGTTFGTEARLVDTNPDAFWSSSFFVRRFLVGNQASPGRYLTGEVQPGSLMSNRWMYLERNLNLDDHLQIAGVAGGVLQACLPNDTLTIAPDGSQLLESLDAARSAPGVDGLMVRLTVYMTRYFTAPEFAHCTGPTEQYQTLVALWAEDLQHGRAPTQNPAVSLVVGAIGLWMAGELVSVPAGRYLVPGASVPVQGVQPPQSVPFGPAAAEVSADGRFVSLDLMNAVPELDSTGQKVDVGSLSLVLTDPDDATTTLGTIDPAGYGREAYEASAGIVDWPVPAGVTAQQLAEGSLSVVAVPRSGPPVNALAEVAITAQTDARAMWVDQGGKGRFTIRVLDRGAVPTATVSVLLQQYLPSPAPPAANAETWTLPTPQQPAVISFDNLPNGIVTLPPSAGGVAEVTFTPIAPGFPIIVCFPFAQGQPAPTPPDGIAPVFVPGQFPSVTTAFYATARVMPFDDDLAQAFADRWNGTHDRRQAWSFVYEEILALYSLLFPVMKYYGSLDLGNQDAVDRNIALLLHLCDASMAGSSVYMPVTRDLSAGKRRVLQMYGELVAAGWPTEAVIVPPPRG